MRSVRFALSLLLLISSIRFVGDVTASRGDAPPETKAYLGIQYEDLKPEGATSLGWKLPRGVRVTKVLEDTPAHKAGLLVGDIILSIDRVDPRGSVARTTTSGSTTTTVFEPRLAVYLGLKKPGDEVELVLHRSGSEQRLTLVLGIRPPEPRPASPVCRGTDLLSVLQKSDGHAYSRIMASADATPNSKGLLWRIEKSGLPPSFLFGTMHVTDDRVNQLSEKVKSAFAASKRAAFEVADMSSAAMQKAQQSIGTAGQYGGGQSLKSELPPAEYARLQQMLEKRGLPGHAFDGVRPFVARMALAIPSCEQLRQGQGLMRLDVRLADDARKRGIPVVGLETGEQQFKSISGISTFSQLALLIELTRSADHLDDELETLVQSYLRKDVTSALKWSRYTFEKAGLPTSALDEEDGVLLTSRNHRMRDAALPLLAEGALFIGVGAGHLPGSEGLVELIRQAGFTVTREE